MNIEDDQIKDAIHLTYRLNYLKDTAMARFIDDSVLATINSLVYVKSQDIVSHIFYNKDILVELLTKMRSHKDMKEKHDAIEFFMEVCQMSKNMQMGSRFSYFETINSFNLIEILAESFAIYQPDIETLKAEVFNNYERVKQILIQKNDESEFKQTPEKVN